MTFSAPKSVPVAWALGDPEQRATIETAHARAVEQAIEYLRERVPVIRRRQSGMIVEDHAKDLVAAEYRHTTSRGVAEGELPDPQLHSHVVVTSAIREDGQLVAVASRPIFRAAREVGAAYRSGLASELQQQGFAIEAGTGKDGRYFEACRRSCGMRSLSVRARSRGQPNSSARATGADLNAESFVLWRSGPVPARRRSPAGIWSVHRGRPPRPSRSTDLG